MDRQLVASYSTYLTIKSTDVLQCREVHYNYYLGAGGGEGVAMGGGMQRVGKCQDCQLLPIHRNLTALIFQM